MADAVKVELQLVKLLEDVVVALNLGVGIADEVAGMIELGHSEDLALFAEVGHLSLDLIHDSIKVSSEGCQRRAVEEEEALTRGSTCGTGGAGAASAAALAQGSLALA